MRRSRLAIKYLQNLFLTVSLSHPPNKIDCIRLLGLCFRSISAPEGSMDMGLNNTGGCLGTLSWEHRQCEPSQEFTPEDLPVKSLETAVAAKLLLLLRDYPEMGMFSLR